MTAVRINFTKMEGLGNDFVVIDAVSQDVSLSSEQVRRIADRRIGIGCDQVLLAERARTPTTDFFYRIHNADGGEVEQCGNGARCLARFLRDRGLTDKSEIRVGTRAGDLELVLNGGDQVTVTMGVPQFQPDQVPFQAQARQDLYELEVAGQTVQIAVLRLGNPHAVQQVADVVDAPVLTQGALIERHPRFPQRVNAGYMQVLDSRHLRVRVFERGVGETPACGSGACAAMVAGRQQGLLAEQVTVALPGGSLRVRWAGEGQPVMMTGPATTVFTGEIELTE